MKRYALHSRISTMAACGLLALLAPAAQAQVADGDFETPTVSGFTTYFAGGSFGSWNVDNSPTYGSGGSVDLVDSTIWQPASGKQSVDLAGFFAGQVSQTVTTVSSQKYDLSFAEAGNFHGGGAIKTMEVFWDGVSQGVFTFDTTGHNATNMGWTTHTLSLVGTGSDTLAFSTPEPDGFGPTLDSVSLTPSSTPEPGTLALLLGASMSGGLLLRRRARK